MILKLRRVEIFSPVGNMINYILDGNNIIGKDKELKQLQSQEPQKSREKLVHLLDRYFSKKKFKVSLHLDGFEKENIRTGKVRLIYSNNKKADDKIRDQIEGSENPKKLTVVTSDRSLAEFAKVCSCTVLKSEELLREIKNEFDKRNEIDIQKEIGNDEIKRLFGV